MSAEFRLESLRYEHEVKLDPRANILYVTTPDELDEFSQEYAADTKINKALPGIRVYDIDWPRLYELYDGIIISPYLYERRLGDTVWYYGWDCASGCIWNVEVIKSIGVLRENDPKKLAGQRALQV